MTREQFENKYYDSPEVWLMRFYQQCDTMKPSKTTFEILHALNQIYLTEEDYMKCKDIKGYKEKLKARAELV